MLVEMRLEDAAPATRRSVAFARNSAESQAGSPAESQAEAAALRGLIAAGLVTHEAIGDPARLPGEAATLRAICGLVAGPVYRLEPFHYAFAARPEDLGGALAGLDSAARTAALTAALAAALGPEAVWIGATDMLPDETEADAEVKTGSEAGKGADAAEIEAAGPAVVDAAHAAERARLTAGALQGAAAETGASPTPGLDARIETAIETRLDARLGAMETALGEMRAALEAQAETTALLSRLNQALGAVLRRLDLQSGVLHAHVAREDAVAARLDELTRIAAGPAGFEEKLGLTLAEFLAGLQRRAEDVGVTSGATLAAPRAPQAG